MPKILKIGATGAEVAALQRALQSAGHAVQPDGWFGEATRAAVRAFQQRAGLVSDGVAGPKTLAALTGAEAAEPLTTAKLLGDADLDRAAQALGVPVAAVRAVNAVESRGSGLLSDGRPVILYERHIAYRCAKAADLDADGLAARYPVIINTRPGGYAGGAAEWSRMGWAQQVLPADICIESASWGLFQIMGFHWQALDYASAADFATRMAASEGEQLGAFVRFINADPALKKALSARKWDEFARIYNGPAYKDNLYDAKLARAYAQAVADEKPQERAA